MPADASGSEEAPGRYLITGEPSPPLLASVTAWCAAQGIFAEDLAVERRSVEDVFLEMTAPELSA